jgi:hypothetical protein
MAEQAEESGQVTVKHAYAMADQPGVAGQVVAEQAEALQAESVEKKAEAAG